MNSTHVSVGIPNQDPTYIAYVFLCPVAIASNLLIILTISREKSLHNKSQFVLISLSAGEIFFSACTWCNGIYKSASYIFEIPDTSSQFACTLRHVPILASSSLVKNLMLALAVDRALCLGAPVFYRNLSIRKYIACLNLICWAPAVGINLLALTSKYDPQLILPACVLTVAADRSFLVMTGVQDNLITLITMIMYTSLAAIFWRRYKRQQQKMFNLAESWEWRRRMDFDVFVAMVIVGSVYCVSYGMISFVMSIGFQLLSSDTIHALSTTALFFVFICSISHVFVYYRVNKLFRNGFQHVVRRQTLVTAFSASTGGT